MNMVRSTEIEDAPRAMAGDKLTRALVGLALRIALPDIQAFEVTWGLDETTGDAVVSDVVVWRGAQHRSITPDEWTALSRAGAPLMVDARKGAPS